MFYNILKNFFLKKNVIKKLTLKNTPTVDKKIQTVGVLVDETYFNDSPLLIDQIVFQGIDKKNISMLIYKDKIKSKEIINEPFLSLKNISLNGEINKKEVDEFLKTPFDLLINYYDVNKSALLLLTSKSNAKFKVGFETVDKRINHLIIKQVVEDYKGFVTELFKYLKILNKIG